MTQPKRLMATLIYNDTNTGMAPRLSAWIDADETYEAGMTYLLQFGDYENPTFTREEMKALDGKKVMVINPDTRETIYTLKELRDITKSWKPVSQREAFERNQNLFVIYPGGRAVEKSTTLAREIIVEELPETPETCPNCGAKCSGGSTVPGDKMKLGLRVFYACGASIALQEEDENGQHVMLKNCSSIGESIIKYPIILGRLVCITIKEPILNRDIFEISEGKKPILPGRASGTFSATQITHEGPSLLKSITDKIEPENDNAV